MAALTVTIPAGSTNGGAGEVIRALAKQLENLAVSIPDLTPTGASTVLTLTSPSATTGLVSIQVTSGPYTTGVLSA